MNGKIKQGALLVLFVTLLAGGLFLIVYSAVNPNVDLMSYVSGGAMLVVALLTIIYVYVTSRQLEVMGEQLEEMKADRQLQSQPLPFISDVRLEIEKPTLYYSPPEGEHEALARYTVKVKVKNVGVSPAVCVDLSARIRLGSNGESRYWESNSINIPTLEEKQEYPFNDLDKDWFLYADDNEGNLLKDLRQRDFRKYPVLCFRVLYRNVLGACFVMFCEHRVYPKGSDNDSMIDGWLSGITTFNIKYKDDIEKLEELVKSNSEKWDELFSKVKVDFDESIGGEDIVLQPWPIPGTFGVRHVDEEEYARLMEYVQYGVRLTDTSRCWMIGEDD